MADTHARGPHDEEPTTPQLISQALENVSQLVSDEVALAKAEIEQTVREVGTGAGLFGAAGLTALYGLGALVAAVIAALALMMPLWLAALLVAIVLFSIAAVAAMLGKKKVDEAPPPIERTSTNVKRDIETVKESRT